MSPARSHLKNGILVQDQGGAEYQAAGILKYVEDLKRDPNTEIGPKDFFEIASIAKSLAVRLQGHTGEVVSLDLG